MEAILADCVQNNLHNFMYRNAIFLCERLCAEFPTEANLQLLAGCFLRNNQAYAAYHLLKGTQMAQSRYLFALSCFQMDLLKEAEAVLCPPNDPSIEIEVVYLMLSLGIASPLKCQASVKHNRNCLIFTSLCEKIPNGAAGHYLLGLVYRYTDRRKSAVHHFKQALILDPLFWAAYDELCVLGSAEEAATVYSESAAISVQKQQIQRLTYENLLTAIDDSNMSTRMLEDASPRQLRSTNHVREATENHQGSVVPRGFANQAANCGPSNFTFFNTPSPVTTTQFSGAAPPPLCRNVQPSLSKMSTDSSSRSTVNPIIQAPRRKFVDEGKLRKISGRLFSDSGSRRSTRLSGDSSAASNATGATLTGNGTGHSIKHPGSTKLSSVTLRSVTIRKGAAWSSEAYEEGTRQEDFEDSSANGTTTTSSLPSGDVKSYDQDDGSMLTCRGSLDASRILTGAVDIMTLLKQLGEGYRLSCLYKCQDALNIYQKLPHKHYNTGWVLSQVGKACFELVDYAEADCAFSLARRLSPYSLEGMDVYSTVLYHLKQDMRLSYLAQELLSTDRLAPQTWCAMGNCYSMQKDHDMALKNFQRAVQLDSRFAYGHTLCGHEYVALEDFENGIKSYQCALRIDSRHYNAWYGLGMVYLRQEKLEFSEHNFRIAFQINPRSSVLMSYLGTALHALQRNEEALMMMEKAIIADRKNPLPMFQKATILVAMGKLDEALEVLEELKEYAPRECSIYALMGKIYKQRSMYDKAMLHFGLALDLKPAAADVASIKAAMEKLLVPDDLDED